MFLVDTSAWIEFFRGTEKGKVVRTEITANRCFVTSESMAEIAKWCFQNSQDTEEKFAEVKGMTESVLYMGRRTEKRAGELCVKVNAGRKRKVGLVDCMIAAINEENGLTVLTLDSDFSEIGVKAKIIR